MIWLSLSELCSQRLRSARSDACPRRNEDLDDQSTDIRVAAAISRYWKQQGYKPVVCKWSCVGGLGPVRVDDLTSPAAHKKTGSGFNITAPSRRPWPTYQCIDLLGWGCGWIMPRFAACASRS